MITIRFTRIDDDARIPQKRGEDAGYDIYACFKEDYIRIPPHDTVVLPTGLASAFPSGYYFQLQERGSTGSQGIAQRCGVIDSGYRGEWFIPLTNTRDIPLYIVKKHAEEAVRAAFGKDAWIYPAEKAICQAILLPVLDCEIVEIDKSRLAKLKSERGEGRLGSSGK